jgi:isoleucyl-tRNA synthetase
MLYTTFTSLEDLNICRIYFQAPMIPYITEHMFQNLRKLIDPESVGDQDIRSVHFLQIPTYRSVSVVCLYIPKYRSIYMYNVCIPMYKSVSIV